MKTRALPKLGQRVTVTARMRKARYDFDGNIDRGDDEDWIAGPRWVRVPCELTGIYCGVKLLHQATMSWDEDAGPDGHMYLVQQGDAQEVKVCIVALSHTQRANVLPGDVEVLPL